jgi:hypothetical protein
VLVPVLEPESVVVVLFVLLEPPPQALSRMASAPVTARLKEVFFDMLKLSELGWCVEVRSGSGGKHWRCRGAIVKNQCGENMGKSPQFPRNCMAQ